MIVKEEGGVYRITQLSGFGYMTDGNIFHNGHSEFEILVRYLSRSNEKPSRFTIITVRVPLSFTLCIPFTVHFAFSFCIL